MEVRRDISRRIDEIPDGIKGMSYGYCIAMRENEREKERESTRCLAWVSLK